MRKFELLHPGQAFHVLTNYSYQLLLSIFLVIGMTSYVQAESTLENNGNLSKELINSNNADIDDFLLGDCCDQVGGKPQELTFRFMGGGCAADNNTQGSKASCTGGVSGSGPFTITEDEGAFVSLSSVSVGDIFTVSSSGSLPNPIFLRLNGGQEIIEFHTSCSAPIVPGDRFGSLELLSMIDDNGEMCGNPCPDPIIIFEELQCIEETATFGLTNPETDVIYVWDFGVDASPSTFTGTNPPVITYSSVGIKNVSLTQDGTCQISIAVNVGQCECPEPEIVYDPLCSDLPGLFSTPDLGQGFSYLWDFGPGATPTTASGIGPHYVFFEGQSIATVKLDIEKDCGPDIVPSGDCCDVGDPAEMTFLYTGSNTSYFDGVSDCSISGTCDSQDPGKVICSPCADPNGQSVRIQVSDKDVPNDGNIYFDGIVSPEEEYTALASNAGQSKISGIFVHIMTTTGALIQSVEIHGSCSQPIAVADQYGSSVLVNYVSTDGSTCGELGAGGGDCCDQINGKPQTMTFRFDGGGCAADANSQDSKSDCTGGVTGSGPFTITEDDGAFIDNSTVSVGDVFTVSSTSNLPNPIMLRINGGQELIEVHTSCSAPLILGERFGSLTLLSFTTDENDQCGPYIEPILCFPCTGSNEVTIEINPFFECPEDVFVDCKDDVMDLELTGEPTISCDLEVCDLNYRDDTVSFDCPIVIERTWTIVVPNPIEPEPPLPQVEPTGDCCDVGDPAKMTFRYTGTNTYELDGSSNCGIPGTCDSQEQGKVICSPCNDPNDQDVRIIVNSKDVPNDGYIFYDGTVSPGTDFMADAANAGKDKISGIYFHIMSSSGTLIQSFEIHGSCSQPIAVGDQYGALLLTGYETIDGQTCSTNNTSGGSGTGDCCDSVSGKPSSMTFRFDGGGCAADNNSQGDKANCTGGVTGTGPFSISEDDGALVSPSMVSIGDTFTISTSGNLPNPIMIRINGGQELIEVHTSCSAPIVLGDRFGSLTLIQMITDNNEQCGPIPPPETPVEEDRCDSEDLLTFTCVQTLTIFDTIAPVISGTVQDLTLGCSDDVPAENPDLLQATDNCTYTTQFEADTTGVYPCDFVITRTWTFTDECDNVVSKSQVITVESDLIATVVVAGDDPIICIDETTQLFGTASGGCGEYSYSWTGPNGFMSTEQNPSGISDAGVYELVVTDKNGCQDRAEIEIFEITPPDPEAGPDQVICKGESVILGSDGVLPEVSYQWFIGNDPIAGATASLLEVDPTTTTEYIVKITTAEENCMSTDTVEVVVDNCNSIGSTVWSDANNNGIIDDGEQGIEGVVVTLLDADGNEINEVTTDENGNYFFEGLMPMTYEVIIKAENIPDSNPLSSTDTDQTEDLDNNDNGDQPGGFGNEISSGPIVLTPGNEPTGGDEQGANADNNLGGEQDDTFDGFGDMTVDFGLIPAIDLELIKTVSVDGSTEDCPIAYVGDEVEFTITVSNNGPNEATGIEVTDRVPNGFESIDASISSGNVNESMITWDIESLGVNMDISLTFTAIVVEPFDGVDYVNIAEITAADQFDIDSTPGNGADTDGDRDEADGGIGSVEDDTTQDLGDEDDGDDAKVEVEIIDLELIKTVSVDGSIEDCPIVNIGDEVIFSITVTNNGPDEATNIEITDLVPNGFEDIDADAQGGNQTGSEITWNISALGSNMTSVVTFTAVVVEPFDGVDYVNIAEITAADQFDIDSTPGNGADTDGDRDEADGGIGSVEDDTTQDLGDEDDGDDAKVEVEIIDLELVKTVSVDGSTEDCPSVNVGDMVSFTITVFNNGPATATNIQVTDLVPNGYGSIDADAQGGTQVGSTVTWNISSLPSGESSILTFTAIVVEPFEGVDYVNIAEITAADQYDADSTPGNGADTDGDRAEADGGIGSVEDDTTQDSGDEDDGDDAKVELNNMSIGSTVFVDINNNGEQDENEPGISGITIEVYDLGPNGIKDNGEADDQLIGSDVTDENGNYFIDGLIPGEVYIKINEVDTNYPVSSAGAGGDDQVDGDDNGIQMDGPGGMVMSEVITLTSGNEPTDEENGQGGDQDDANDTNGDMTIDFGFFEPASIGDFVFEDLDYDGIQDEGEPGIPGVTVSLTDSLGNEVVDVDGNVVGPVMTGDDGLYLFDNLFPGDYKVTFEAPEGFEPTQENVNGEADDEGADDSDANEMGMSDNVWLDSGEDEEDIDAGFFEPASIGDFVFEDLDYDGIQDEGEPGVPGVTVSLTDSLGNEVVDVDGNVVGPVMTGDDGLYLFDNLFPGDYKVTFEAPEGFEPTQENVNGEADDEGADDSDANEMGMSDNVWLDSGEDEEDIDAGFFEPASIGDFVFEDLDYDGIQDEGEPGVPGVTVSLTDSLGNEVVDVDGNVVGPVMTGDDGLYLFDNLLPGDYKVTFEAPEGFEPTQENVNGEADDEGADDSDANEMGMSDNVWLDSGEDEEDIDAGFFEPASIGDFVFEDLDYDGIQDEGEPGIPGVTVSLTDSLGNEVVDVDGNVVGPVMTGDDGLYLFDNLFPGDYKVTFEAPEGFEPTQENVNGEADDEGADDSDANEMGMSDNVWLDSGEDEEDIDAGFFEPASIGDFVFEDMDGDGIQDGGEPGIPGVTVSLTDSLGNEVVDVDGNVVGPVMTGDDGLYLFDNLLPGDYKVTFEAPEGFEPTQENVNGEADDEGADDSDPNEMGMSDNVWLDSGEEEEDIDAGFTKDGKVCLYTFKDCDNNGDLRGDEPLVNVPFEYLYTNTAGAQINGAGITDPLGNACITLSPGVIDITIFFPTSPTGLIFTTPNAVEDEFDSDADENGRIPTIIVISGSTTEVAAGFKDVEKPTLINVTADYEVECDAVYFPETPKATDNCDENIVVTRDSVITPGDCPNQYVVEYVWTAKDKCGNEVKDWTTLKVDDTKAPVAMNQPEDITIDCGDPIPPYDPEWKDNCSEELELTAISSTSYDGCREIQTMKYTAIDECGNEASVTRKITMVDMNKPEILNVPANYQVECDEVTYPETPKANDLCEGYVEVSRDSTITDGECPQEFTIIYTWTATDKCGNEAKAETTVSVVDTKAPVATNLPTDIEISCGDPIPQYDPEWKDNCSEDLTITAISSASIGGCTEIQTMKYTAIDECGNEASVTRKITIVDTNKPEILNVPLNYQVECDAVTYPETPKANDLCEGYVEVSRDSTITDGECPQEFTIVYTWTATDKCGNEAKSETIVSVVDTKAPVAMNPPTDVVINCTDEIPPYDPQWKDNCSVDIELTAISSVGQTECGEIQEYVYTATDECGNTAKVIRKVTIEDDQDPYFDGLVPDQTISCEEPIEFGTPTFADNCGIPTLTFEDDRKPGRCPYEYVVIRTWTITDQCGNTASTSARITVWDNKAPEILNVPEGGTFECDEVVYPETPKAIDNCSGYVEVSRDSLVVSSEECPQNLTITYTWTATDECGNTSSEETVIKIKDTTAPVIGYTPEDVVIQLSNGDAIPSAPEVKATDNCDPEVFVELDEKKIPSDCGYILKRTWTAVDDCGNEAEVKFQEIKVIDGIDPVITPAIAEVCEGYSVDYSVNLVGDEYTYEWSVNGGGSLSNSDTPTATFTGETFGTFTITVKISRKDAPECYGETSATIKVRKLPRATISNNGPLCLGQTIMLGATGGVSYAWSGPNDFVSSVQNPMIENATEANAGTYTVVITADDCSTTLTTEVEFYPNPEIQITSNSPVCLGETVELVASGGTDYMWRDSDDNILSTEAKLTLENVDQSDAGTYTVMVANSNRCSGEATTEVVITDKLDDIVTKIEICEGESYIWEANGQTYTAAGTYEYESEGCKADQYLKITIVPKKEDVITTIDLCQGESYVWEANGQTYTEAGSYQIEVEGCEANQYLKITVLPKEDDVIVDIVLCYGESYIWEANGQTYVEAGNHQIEGEGCEADQYLKITVLPKADDVNIEVDLCQGESYVWEANGQTYTVAGTYQIEGEGCEADQYLKITIVPKKEDVITKIEICLGESYVWEANGQTYTVAGTYQIEGEGCEADQYLKITIVPKKEDVITLIEICLGESYIWEANGQTYTEAGTYEIEGEGCEADQYLKITILPKSEDKITNVSICEGDSYTWEANNQVYTEGGTYRIEGEGCYGDEILVLDYHPEAYAEIEATKDAGCDDNDGYAKLTPASNSYAWSDGGTGAVRSNLASGNYSVTVTSLNGCEKALDLNIGMECECVYPVIEKIETTDVSCEGLGSATVTLDSDPSKYTYTWSPNEGITEGATDNARTNLPAGKYDVIITFPGAQDCFAKATLTIGEGDSPIEVTADVTNGDCENKGAIKLLVSGGSGEYTFDWEHIDGTTNDKDISSLDGGNYTVKITDTNGCSFELSDIPVFIDCEPCDMLEDVTVETTDETCNEKGSARFTPDAYTYTWQNDGVVASYRSGLNAGSYIVVAEDPVTKCKSTIEVIIDKVVPGDASITVDPEIQLTCEDENGVSIDFEVTYGDIFTQPAQILIVAQNGQNVPNGSLTAGEYCIYVKDANGCTITKECVILKAPIGVKADYEVIAAECDQGGAIDITISEGIAPFIYTWSDGNTSEDRLDVAAGTYNVTIVDGNLCEMVISGIVVVTNCDPCPDGTGPNVQVAKMDTGCEDSGSITLIVPDDANYIYDWNDLDGSDNPQNRSELGAGVYEVTVSDYNGCAVIKTVEIDSNCDPCPDGTGPSVEVTKMDTGCDAIGTITLIVPDDANYVFDWNDLDGTDDAQNRSELAKGTYEVTVTDTNGCSVIATVDIDSNCDPGTTDCDIFDQDELSVTTAECDGGAKICLGVQLDDFKDLELQLNGQNYSDGITACNYATTYSYQFRFLLDATPNGPYRLEWSYDDLAFVQDSLNDIAELAEFIIENDPSGNWTYNEEEAYLVGGNTDYDYSALRIYHYQTAARYELNINTIYVPSNVEVTLPVGEHEIVIIDSNESCTDTVRVTVICENSEEIERTIAVGDQIMICLSDVYKGDNATFANTCESDEDNAIASYNDIDDCITFSGNKVGSQVFCYENCDGNGNCKLTTITINVTPPNHRMVFITMVPGEDTTYCLDVSDFDLNGTINDVSLGCEDDDNEAVDFQLNDANDCIEISAQALGEDDACLKICDDLMECDSLTIIVNVIEPTGGNGPLPNAVDNDTLTLKDNDITIRAIDNDQINGTLVDAGLVTEPRNGIVTVIPGGVFIYTPNQGFCGEEDSFTYFIENENGSDTATVNIMVMCDELIIFSGFSPNGDGINDRFEIIGIENYPDNTVCVFNRWGNQVLMKKGYTNTEAWEGDWNEGDLPDGTYFYVIDLGNGGDKKSGYVQILR